MKPITFNEQPFQPNISSLWIPEERKFHDDLYELQDDFTYIWRYEGRYGKIFIPKGLLTDGASVPGISGLLDIHPDGPGRPAFVLHDVGYMLEGDWPKGSIFEWNELKEQWEDMSHIKWGRKSTDRLMARVLRECGVKRWKRRLEYRSVRVGGWKPWKFNSKLDIEHAEHLRSLYK